MFSGHLFPFRPAAIGLLILAGCAFGHLPSLSGTPDHAILLTSMTWQRIPVAAVKRRMPPLCLDESVDAFVQQLLRELKIRVESAAQAGLLGHADQDHFAYCWKRRKVLVTFDFDFLDYKNPNLPDTRNPGVIVMDCDTRKRDQVLRTVSYVPRVAEIVGGRGWRHTRTVVGPTGRVRVRRRNPITGAHDVELYRFSADDQLERWIGR